MKVSWNLSTLVGTTRARFLSNVGALSFVEIAALALNLAASVFIARSIGPEGYGVFAICIAFTALISPVAELGLNAIVTRELLNRPGHLDIILGSALAMRMGASLVGVPIGLAIFVIFGVGSVGLEGALAVLLFGDVFLGFRVFQFWCESRSRLFGFGVAKLAAVVIAATLKIVAAAATQDVFWICVAHAARPVIWALGIAFVYSGAGQRIGRLSPRISEARRPIRESKVLILSGFAGVIYQKIDLLMLGSMVGARETGVYAVAAQLSEFWYFLPAVIVSAAHRHLQERRKAGEASYKAALQRLMDSLALLGFAVVLATSLLGPAFVRLVFGEAYSASATILIWHVWGGIFVAIRAAFSRWMIIEGQTKHSLGSHAAGSVVNVGLNLVLIPTFGAIGAAVATVAAYLFSGYIYLYFWRSTRSLARIETHALLILPRLVISAALKLLRRTWTP